MKTFWNERYSQPDYVYGEEPNAFFREQLEKLPPGKLLLPAEGEGRNAVFAASKGWEVTAFDQSEEGKKKAEALARKFGVKITYTVMGCHEMSFPVHTFDAIALIFAHFPSAMRTQWHQQLITFLKPGGIFVLEAFSVSHQVHQQNNPQAGGPRDPDMLCTVEGIRRDFHALDILHCEQTDIQLDEGRYHTGHATVVRFAGQKKQTS